MRDYLEHPQASLYGKREVVGFGDERGISVRQIGKDRADALIRAGHYSGTVCWSSNEHLGIFDNGTLVGCIQLGPAMNPASGAKIVEGTEPDGWTELNRMWISDDAPTNCA
ncbi:MAG: Mom family adenine methylcarbamoylation protein, partial [Planctomycetota bacterium]